MERNMILRRFLQRQIPRQSDIPKQRPNISLKQWLNGSKPSNPLFLKQQILNFFISQGLYDVGVQFSKQAGISMPDIEKQQVKARYNVKRLIEQGKVDEGLQQLEKLKNKKIKPNEEMMSKREEQRRINISEQGIQMQEIKSKRQDQTNQKKNQKQEKIEGNFQQLPQAQNKLQKPTQNLKYIEKNEEQRPLLQLFEQSISSSSSSGLNINEKDQPSKKMQDNKLQQNHYPQQPQKMFLKDQVKDSVHPIFQNEKNKDLLFNLTCLKVVQLIKKNQIQQSIKVAKQQLLLFAKKKHKEQANYILDQQQMQKIEKVMSLIAFSNLEESPNYALTTAEFRAKVAHQLNIHLLDEQNTESITALVRLTKWCEKRLKKHIDFPQLNLSSATLYD